MSVVFIIHRPHHFIFYDVNVLPIIRLPDIRLPIFSLHKSVCGDDSSFATNDFIEVVTVVVEGLVVVVVAEGVEVTLPLDGLSYKCCIPIISSAGNSNSSPTFSGLSYYAYITESVSKECAKFEVCPISL